MCSQSSTPNAETMMSFQTSTAGEDSGPAAAPAVCQAIYHPCCLPHGAAALDEEG